MGELWRFFDFFDFFFKIVSPRMSRPEVHMKSDSAHICYKKQGFQMLPELGQKDLKWALNRDFRSFSAKNAEILGPKTERKWP